MGFVSMISACAGCSQMFSYNPLRVPSIPIDGVREPICSECMAALNAHRVALQLEPIAIAPDAYSGCDERELPEVDE